MASACDCIRGGDAPAETGGRAARQRAAGDALLRMGGHCRICSCDTGMSTSIFGITSSPSSPSPLTTPASARVCLFLPLPACIFLVLACTVPCVLPSLANPLDRRFESLALAASSATRTRPPHAASPDRCLPNLGRDCRGGGHLRGDSPQVHALPYLSHACSP